MNSYSLIQLFLWFLTYLSNLQKLIVAALLESHFSMRWFIADRLLELLPFHTPG